MSRSRARLAAAVTTALLTTAGLVLVAPAAVAAGPTATFTKTSDWGTGWEGNYRIANPGPAAITSWTVEFSSLWDATWSQSGAHLTARNASWNGTIAAGGSASFGFGVVYDGTNWWSYDDPQVIAQKTAYVKSKGLGGVMAWELDGDDGTLTAAVDSGLR